MTSDISVFSYYVIGGHGFLQIPGVRPYCIEVKQRRVRRGYDWLGVPGAEFLHVRVM